MSIPFPIPTGLRPKAQGCPVGGTTLGNAPHFPPQPQRGCVHGGHADGCNPFRVVFRFNGVPRVASRPRQPWAKCRHPVGVKTPRTLAALRDALLPKLLSGELCVTEAMKG